MAEGTINAYNLADSGVDVDKTQIQKVDGTLTKAQNATTDTTGVGGGVRKRPGLIEHNATPLAGTVKGGIGAPITLEANSINGTTLAGGPTRTFYWGRALVDSGSLDVTEGWLTSTNGFTTAATEIVAGTPADPRAGNIGGSSPGAKNMATISQYSTGAPSAAVVVNNKLYYADSNYVYQTTNPSIRVFDGVTDAEFARVPNSPTGVAHPIGIATMIAANGTIYLTVADTQTGGRVFSLNPSSGALTPLGAQFTTDKCPYALCWHLGRLWMGTTSQAGFGKIFFFRPNIDTAWTASRTMAIGTGCSSLASFQGQLFAGARGGGGIEVMSPLGVWANSLTTAGTEESMALIVFKSNLYANVFLAAGNVNLIKKFDGTTWTTVLSGASAKSAPMPSSWVEQGTLFFGGGGDTYATVLVSSTDGTTWTDRTANVTATANRTGLSSFGVLVT